MAIGSDQKLSKFLLAINSYAEQRKEQIHREVEEFKAQELKKAEDKVLQESYLLIHKEMSAMRIGINRDISRRELESRRRLFAHRKTITEDVFSTARKKLLEYCDSTQYEGFLLESAKRVSALLSGFNDITVYISERDKNYAPLIRDVFGSDCKIEFSDTIEIGGMKGNSIEAGLIVDDSIDSRLEAGREWFLENSALRLE